MANGLNLKTVFTADTKDLKKGAADAKQAVKDFDSATTAALDEVTGLFNTSMGEIGKTLSTIKGGFMVFSAAITYTTQATNLATKAMNLLKVALASTGIGALVVALGSLVAYFTKSQQGADALAVVMGQLKQVFLVVSDAAINIGRSIINGITKGYDAIAGGINKLREFLGLPAKEAKKEEDAVKSVFQRRYDLTKRQQKLERDQIQWTVDKAKLQTEIEQQREIVADKAGKTAEERLAANLKAQELTAQLYAQEKAFAQERLDILKEENSLSESMNQDLQAEADLEAELISLEGQRASRTKELLSQQSEITNQVIKEREEREKIAALQNRKKSELTLEKIDSSNLLNQKVTSAAITPTIDTSKVKEGAEEIEGYMVDFGKIASDFSSTVADAFATMIEGLMAGNLNMTDIFSSLLQFLSENLKAIGKALIAYGTAMEAFKEAFSNPWAAIAAGAALVAAGAVLSGLIQRASSGGGSSAATSYAAATAAVGGGGSLDLTSQTQRTAQSQEVKVTGRIVASGRDVALIIENENKRKSLTT